MRFLVLIVISLFLISPTCLYSQDSSITFYSEGGKFMADLGFMFNQPRCEPNKSKYIRYNFIPDLNLDFGYLITNANHHGWLFLIGCSSKNYAFTVLDKDGSSGTASLEFSNLYYHFTIKKTVDFNISEKTNIIISAGPALILNQRGYGPDSLTIYSPQQVELEDIKAFGAAVNFSANLVRKIKNNKFIFVKASYQYGFIDFMQATITNPTFGVKRNFLYDGTGPALKLGFIF